MTDQEIKESLKDKINQLYTEYLEKIRPYQKALEALGEDISIHNVPKKQLIKVTIKKPPTPSNITMKQKLIQVLKDAHKPLTSREIMEAINKKYPDNIYDLKKFSGNFSQTYPKAGIVKYERSDEPIETRVVYGLKSWFEADNELKLGFKELLNN